MLSLLLFGWLIDSVACVAAHWGGLPSSNGAATQAIDSVPWEHLRKHIFKKKMKKIELHMSFFN